MLHVGDNKCEKSTLDSLRLIKSNHLFLDLIVLPFKYNLLCHFIDKEGGSNDVVTVSGYDQAWSTGP